MICWPAWLTRKLTKRSALFRFLLDSSTAATQPQIDAWKILVKVLRARYDIPLDRVYEQNWVDFKDARYCEGCALATLAREWGE